MGGGTVATEVVQKAASLSLSSICSWVPNRWEGWNNQRGWKITKFEISWDLIKQEIGIDGEIGNGFFSQIYIKIRPLSEITLNHITHVISVLFLMILVGQSNSHINCLELDLSYDIGRPK